jgi:hypothetical protein
MKQRHARKIFFLMLIFAVSVFPLAAQETDIGQEIDDIEAVEDEEIEYDEIEDGGYGDTVGGDENADLPITSEWGGMPLTGYTRGDKLFNINVGIIIPLFFLSASGDLMLNKLYAGGILSLAYHYFLNSNLFFGAILQWGFAQTLGENFLYLVPIGVTLGYQFVVNRFEFPVSITLGGMSEQYLTYNGYWPFLKPQAACFFRFNSNWSFGINTAWFLVPQWSNTPEKDATGNFMEITLSARYHL